MILTIHPILLDMYCPTIECTEHLIPTLPLLQLGKSGTYNYITHGKGSHICYLIA
jgi:hypothetical protein